MKKLIKLAKNMRKQKYLNLHYSGQYAFVGVGNHSMQNLYPVLHHLRVPIKYIVTSSDKNAQSIDQHFDHVIGTSNLGQVLNDPEIKGVLICADPSAHFGLVQRVLEAGKSVFVEKPPCQTLSELEALIATEQHATGFSMVGLQKRYAPAYAMVKEKAKNVISYQLHYRTGLYPEGNPVTDLFIHALDAVNYLFGPATIASVETVSDGKKGACSIFLHLKHGAIVGSLELSTEYTWSRANELLTINTSQGCYVSENCESLTFEDKAGSVLSIPKEKVWGHQPTTTALIHRNGFLPLMEHNSLHTAGFFNEVENFIHLCEGEKADNHSGLVQLRNTYQLMQAIEGKLNV